MDNLSVQPWYRQFWPWFVFSLPAAAVVAGFVTLYLAGSAPAMVVDDYGQIAKTTTQRIERRNFARELGLGAELEFFGQREGVPGELWITLTQTYTPSTWPQTLQLQLIHPTQADHDQSLTLVGSGGRYRVSLEKPAGRFYLALTDSDGNWRLTGELGRDAETALLTAGGS